MNEYCCTSIPDKQYSWEEIRDGKINFDKYEYVYHFRCPYCKWEVSVNRKPVEND